MAVEYAALIYCPAVELEQGLQSLLEMKFGGKAALNHSIDAFDADPACHEIILAAEPKVYAWVSGNPLAFASPKMQLMQAETSSVATYMKTTAKTGLPFVVLHNALRPNFGADLLARLLATVKPDCGAAPAWAAPAPLVRLEGLSPDAKPAAEGVLGPKAEKRLGYAGELVGSQGLYQLQMPQAFGRESYMKACKKTLDKVPPDIDPATLYTAAGNRVALVRGRIENVALTGEPELRLLQKLLGTGPVKKDKYTGLGW